MQRPCFALAVLLGSLSSSMLVVSKVNSQSPAVAATDLPRPVSVRGGRVEPSAIRVLRGQSIDAEVDGWSEENGGADQVASDECRQRDQSLLATSRNVDWSTNLWWNLLKGSYGKAQDLVVCGRHCLAVAAVRESASETSPPVHVADAEPADVTYLTLGPTNMVACEDYFDSLPEEVQEPVLLTEDCGAWLWQGLEGTQDWANKSAEGWWAMTRGQAEQLRNRVAQTILAPSIAEEQESVPVTTFSANAAMNFQAEVLLITVANSLDHLSLRLQDAAQQLRYWAADRIVSKGNLRRVANKSTH